MVAKVTKVYFVNVYVCIFRNIWLSLPTVKIDSEIWCKVLSKFMYCEKYVVTCVTFL